MVVAEVSDGHRAGTNWIMREQIIRNCSVVDNIWQHKPCLTLDIDGEHGLEGNGKRCYDHCAQDYCNGKNHTIERQG